MDTHKNASLTPRGREAMARSVVEGGLSKATAAHQFNTTPKTVAKWVGRFQAEGVAGLQDRSSRPHSSPSQTTPAQCAGIEGLRRRAICRGMVGCAPIVARVDLRDFGSRNLKDQDSTRPP